MLLTAASSGAALRLRGGCALAAGKLGSGTTGFARAVLAK